MARRPRFAVTGLPFHLVQRGNDRDDCFRSEADYRFYLKALREAVAHYRVAVHAYVLMTNHVHLLVTPLEVGSMSRVLQSVGARYVAYFNAKHTRTGTLWEGRYKACLVQHDRYVLAVCRYIDLNPVRACMVSRPGLYPFSSYRGLAGLRDDAMLTPHDSLRLLPGTRGAGYARWCEESIDRAQIDALRRATESELVYGTADFKREIAMQTARQTVPKARGRRCRHNPTLYYGSDPN